VAPGRLPTVLETDFESEEADREKTDAEAGAAVDLSDGHDRQSASAIRRIRNNILEPDQKLVVSSCPWSVLVCGSGSRLVTRPLLKFSNSVYKTSDVCIVAALPRILRDA